MQLPERKRELTAEEAEELFSDVDETGHTNRDLARFQRKRRAEIGTSVDVDPLSEDDPSGSDVEKVVNRAAMLFVLVALAAVLLAQLSCSVIRRAYTSTLAEEVNVRTVASALRIGVEWGDGFTQFPEEFTVQEADESTGRIEVSVVDSTSSDALECLSSSQIQATAFSINALLNPNIYEVRYHVSAHMDAQGRFERPGLFGFGAPTGEVRSFITFIWTKKTTANGIQFSCTITGVDESLTEVLRDRVVSPTITFPGISDDGGSDSSGIFDWEIIGGGGPEEVEGSESGSGST
ncbi:MAG: hypothetical protein IJH87_01305 [Atopobiaceae bacterium]|nr:hypothetical protein [Atopobiaceae bacterium]